jgi:transposase InsO family protein
MPEIHERTVGRVMALNKRVYPDIPHVAKKRRKQEPQPHPFKASVAHEYWFIDGRIMDFEIEGVRWWSVIVLDGYSRTMLAGALSASEASWIALTVLFTACQRYGAPQYLSLWLRHVAQLSLLCGRRVAQDEGVALGLWQ